MAVKARTPDIKTPLMRLAFAQGLFKLQEKKLSGRKEWNCSLLIPKTQSKAFLDELVATAATEAWGIDKVKKMIETGTLKNPILDGDGPQAVNKKSSERNPGFAGNWFIRCGSGEEFRPKLVDQNVLPITDQNTLFSGCYVYAVISAYAWESSEQPYGVSFGVSMVQKVKDGDRLGGGSGPGNPEDVFQKIADEGAAPAETKGGKGAAGLFG